MNRLLVTFEGLSLMREHSKCEFNLMLFVTENVVEKVGWSLQRGSSRALQKTK